VRKKQLLQAAEDIIDSGEKPSARKLADETGFHQRDVHGLLNALEKDGAIESYTEEVLGRRLRRVSLIRQR
jgi:DNA-binding MarR family transcriptional regulator